MCKKAPAWFSISVEIVLIWKKNRNLAEQTFQQFNFHNSQTRCKLSTALVTFLEAAKKN